MEDLSIILVFNLRHFKELYYHNNEENIFKYKPTQTAILYCLLTALITFTIFLASFKKPEISWLIVLGSIIFVFKGIYAIYVVTKHLNWKSSIEKFLKEMAAYKSHHLKLTSGALELIQDSNITIERWVNIKSAQIFDDHITLYKSNGPAFIFPAKSMNAEEFFHLKDFIINKITIRVSTFTQAQLNQQPISKNPNFHIKSIPMRHYLCAFSFLLTSLSCNNLSPETKKQIKKTGKEIAKQVTATVEHLDMAHDYIDYEVKPDSGQIRMYWKDNKGDILGSLGRLQQYTAQQGYNLLYACNGGMYMQNQAPLGYYVEDGKTLQKINTKTGVGNFYLKPKGIFYTDEHNIPHIQSIETAADRILLESKKITYLTQSGPMLVHNNVINPFFTQGSTNMNVRNGAGILPNGHAYFAMSTYPVSFHDFANHFKDKGCSEALYFDGFVSRSFCPQQNYSQLDGNFGVIIAIVNSVTAK